MVEESNARVNLGGCSFTYSEPDVFFYLGFLHIRYSLPLFRVDASGGESRWWQADKSSGNPYNRVRDERRETKPARL
jgi:hypothetical protein